MLDACGLFLFLFPNHRLATHGYEIELFLDQLKITEVYRVLLVLFSLVRRFISVFIYTSLAAEV